MRLSSPLKTKCKRESRVQIPPLSRYVREEEPGIKSLVFRFLWVNVHSE